MMEFAGLHSGRIVGNLDPSGGTRVLIEIPSVFLGEPIWARVAGTHAGVGEMSSTKIGTEVIVGFLDGDADNPIVLGVL